MDGFEPGEHAWQSAAYYQLGNLLWYSNLDAGINLYGSSISSDQKNWAAYAPLGRIWIEKSQEQPDRRSPLSTCCLQSAIWKLRLKD